MVINRKIIKNILNQEFTHKDVQNMDVEGLFKLVLKQGFSTEREIADFIYGEVWGKDSEKLRKLLNLRESHLKQLIESGAGVEEILEADAKLVKAKVHVSRSVIDIYGSHESAQRKWNSNSNEVTRRVVNDTGLDPKQVEGFLSDFLEN